MLVSYFAALPAAVRLWTAVAVLRDQALRNATLLCGVRVDTQGACAVPPAARRSRVSAPHRIQRLPHNDS